MPDRNQLNQQVSTQNLGKIIGTAIAGIVAVATIAPAVLQPEETRSCLTLDARGCPFLRSFASGESDVGANYGKLRELLQKKDYQGANQETGRLILWLAGRAGEGSLDERSMKRLPCRDLQTINQLWSENSNGRFGFKTQKDIWQSLKKYKSEEKPAAFGYEVGWRKNNRWLNSPSELSFGLRAPKGHLPARYGEGEMSGGWLAYPILSGLAVCDLEAKMSVP